MFEYRRGRDGLIVPRRETRRATRLELRDADDRGLTLWGYALVYDQPVPIAGGPPLGFIETVARGAADKTVRESDVRLLVNHEGLPLARTRSGTLRLASDEIGVRVEAELDPSSPAVAELRSAMLRGDLDQMSFAFRAVKQAWNEDWTERTLQEIALHDVSVVAFPANEATVVLLDEAAPEPVRSSGSTVEMRRRELELLVRR